MKTRTKVMAITLVFAVPTFLLGKIIWPPVAVPPAQLLPFYIFLVALESLLFGLGVSFLIFGLPVVRRVLPEYRRLAFWSYLAIAWQMVSWWPHDNLHAHIGMDFFRLLGIEYGFHLTLMISAVILAYAFFKSWSQSRTAD